METERFHPTLGNSCGLADKTGKNPDFGTKPSHFEDPSPLLPGMLPKRTPNGQRALDWEEEGRIAKDWAVKVRIHQHCFIGGAWACPGALM